MLVILRKAKELSSIDERSKIGTYPKGLQVPKDTAAMTQIEEIQIKNSMYNDQDEYLKTYMTCLQPGEPGSLEEAKQGPVWPKWEKAIKTKLAALEKKETWELVDEPSNTNIIGSHWVFRLKHNAGGRITQHRARLVAQGYIHSSLWHQL